MSVYICMYVYSNSDDERGDVLERQDDSLPGARRAAGDDGSRNVRLAARTSCVRFSPTGSEPLLPRHTRTHTHPTTHPPTHTHDREHARPHFWSTQIILIHTHARTHAQTQATTLCKQALL